MNVIINRLLVNYTREGDGPTLLLLHGWADQLHTFDALIIDLKSDYDIVLLDLAGFGKSQAPDAPWGLDDYADYVVEFLKKLSISPHAIIGHSNGGAIAIKLVANQKVQAKSLVLLSSAGIRNIQKSRKLLWNIVAKLGKLATFLLPVSIRKSLRNTLYKSVGSDLTVAPRMEETFKRVIGEDVQKDAVRVAIPTLIISGTEDTATPLLYAQMYHRLITGSSLKPIEGADHFVHQSHNQDVSRYVREFL